MKKYFEIIPLSYIYILKLGNDYQVQSDPSSMMLLMEILVVLLSTLVLCVNGAPCRFGVESKKSKSKSTSCKVCFSMHCFHPFRVLFF